MGKPAAGATPSLATQLQQKHQTGNKPPELQQSPTHSEESINPILCKISDGLSAFQRCLSELHRHVDTIRTSIDSSILLLLRPHTTNTTPPAAAPQPTPVPDPEPSEEGEEKEAEEEEQQQLKSPPCSEPKSSHSELKSPPHSEPLKFPSPSEPKLSRSELKSPSRSEHKSPPRSELKSPPHSEPKSSRFELKFPPPSEPKSSRLELKSPSRFELKSLPRSEPKSPPRSEPKSFRLEMKSPPRSEPKSFRLELKSPPRSEPKSFRLELKSPPRPEPQSFRLELKSPPHPEPQSFRLELKSPPRPEPKSFRIKLISPPRPEKKSPGPEVKILCETMNSHGLRKYMIRRLSCIKTLKQKVPNALKLSPNPARLIMKSIGMFYTQGSNAYVEGSPLIKERQALVLLLECFLKMMGKVEDEGEGVVEIEDGVKEEAQQAAITWYRRLILEGGILKAQEIDARGLLLLIGCFGIPQAFRNEDIKDLLHQSYIKMISGSLKRSRYLMAKIPELIEGMLEQKMVIEAVYFSLCFGLENRFNPQRLLRSLLHESEVTLLNKLKRSEQMGSQDSVVGEIIGAKRRYLASLKSVIQCLGRNNIDHSKLPPEWKIGKKVISLEREIAQLRKSRKGDQRMVLKRKIDETELLSNKQVKLSDFPNPGPHQQQRVVNHVDRNNTLLEIGGTAGHIYGHAVYPLVLHGPVAGSIHENVVGSLVGPVGGVAVAGPGAGISVGTDVVLSRVNGSHGDATVYHRLPSHRYAYRPSSYLEGPNTITGDAYSRLAPCMESSKGLPNTKPGDFNRPPPHFGGLMGLSNTVPPPYQLAGTGPATELYRSSSSRAVDSVPSAAVAHPSSSLYWQR